MEKAVAETEAYSEPCQIWGISKREYFLQNTPPKMFDASEKCSYDPVKYHC